MVEDSAPNLAEPHRLGISTVWMDHGDPRPTPDYVDLRVTDLEQLIAALDRL